MATATFVARDGIMPIGVDHRVRQAKVPLLVGQVKVVDAEVLLSPVFAGALPPLVTRPVNVVSWP